VASFVVETEARAAVGILTGMCSWVIGAVVPMPTLPTSKMAAYPDVDEA